jgi:hypothetical protein
VSHHARRVPRAARALRTKVNANKTNNGPATLGAAGFAAEAGVLSSPPATAAAARHASTRMLVIAPSSGSRSQRAAGLELVVVVGLAVLILAMWLIGSDLRKRLNPVGQHHTFGGTVLKPSASGTTRVGGTQSKNV